MVKAKRRRASDHDGNPLKKIKKKSVGMMRILDMDDILKVFTLTPRGEDCVNRCLIVAQCFPGSKVQAGQVVFWDYAVQQYDGAFNFHMWIVNNGQIYDSFDALKRVFHSLNFPRLEPENMIVRFATEEDNIYAENKTTDAVYFPGLDFPNERPNTPTMKALLQQTREHGQLDIEMAIDAFRIPRYVA